jgi:signal transduction histidine kinase
VPELTLLNLSPLLERGLLYVAVAVATLVAFTNWRRGNTRAFREPLIAFFALCFVEGALLAAAAQPTLLPPAIVYGLDFATTTLLAWAFLASSLPERVNTGLLAMALTLTAAFVVFSISAARIGGAEPAWATGVWSIVTLGVSGGAALVLGVRRSDDRNSGSIAAFVALAASATLDLLALPDLARLARPVAFSLFPVGLFQRALSDLHTVHQTLREFSQSALKQTQELVTLLEASTYLFTSFDLDELLRRVVQHAAAGIDADRAVIVLASDGAPQMMRVGSTYPRGLAELGQTFLLNTQPALAVAISSGEPASVGPRGLGASQLAKLLNMSQLGPTLIQPLVTQDNTIGAFVAANPHGEREFSDGQRRLLEALSAQIAAAIVNAQMYHSLDTQARELARVLAERERDVTWHTSILESIGDGVLVADTSDRVALANAVIPKLLDTPIEYVLNRKLGAIFERLTPMGGSAQITPPGQLTGSDVVRAAFTFGERALHVSMSPVHSIGGDRLGVVVLLRDITQQHRREQERIRFIGTIAQEFRTPLETIKGYADLLAKGAAGTLPSAARGFVETIRGNAERLSAQVSAILQFNELDRGRIDLNVEEADIASILADAANEYRPRFEARGLSLQVNVRANLPTVHADRKRVRQVLDQLIDNAFKFTPSGGHVTLAAAPSWDGLAERPAFVSITVSDTGVGFDRRDSQRLFEAFQRGDHPAQIDQAGLGIGLSIARGVCEAMGGQLWGRAEKDRGAVFTFILPVARVTEPPLSPPGSEPSSADAWIEQALSFLDDDDELPGNR